ncbi:MauE/DoxX family redox-associated membrane protein [Pedobacter sp. JCM 36344]|uniref:DoxX family protein n=1 Tax=Pedobacter sp. JCM 36344 TaxID=3374280 RepID=UPI003978E7A6
MAATETTTFQKVIRIILGLFMIFAGIGHLTLNRSEFQAQVPNWIPLDKDLVVLLSGIVEISLGLAMLFWKDQRAKIGIALAIFYILIFPGNIAQYLNHTDAFGLNSDKARLIRLFFQPILILGALWSTGVFRSIKK